MRHVFIFFNRVNLKQPRFSCYGQKSTVRFGGICWNARIIAFKHRVFSFAYSVAMPYKPYEHTLLFFSRKHDPGGSNSIVLYLSNQSNGFSSPQFHISYWVKTFVPVVQRTPESEKDGIFLRQSWIVSHQSLRTLTLSSSAKSPLWFIPLSRHNVWIMLQKIWNEISF